MKSLNIVFAGTPAFGLPCLDALKASVHTIQAIYTQPDRPAGRGRALQASAVKEWALREEIPIYQPLNFKETASIETLNSLKPDLLVVIAYGLILPESVLSIPPLGAINVHASLLPRWRGASPIQHAIWYGDSRGGVSIMQMDKGMDTGPVFSEVSYMISQDETAGSLHDQLAALSPPALLNCIEALAKGEARPIDQNNAQATYAPKIQKEDAKIDWQKTAVEMDRLIRAFNPWPIAFTTLQGEMLRIHQAEVIDEPHSAPPGTILKVDKSGLYVACQSNILCLQKIQFSGGKVISVADCLNSGRLTGIVNQVIS